MKKIIFFKVGSFSHINDSVYNFLSENFPEQIVEECDVFELVRKEHTSLINYYYLFKEYGIDILLKKKYHKDWLFCTSYLFKKIRKKILSKYDKDNDVIFTFQTQSLFDASLPNINHYVYTDSTVLANFYYKNVDSRSFLKSKKWMKLERALYNDATLNFVFSSNQKKSLVEQYHIDSKKVKCVFAGSNIEVPNNIQTFNSYEKRILFVGVNWERKGGVELYHSFLELLKDIPDAKLTVVGCSPDINHANVEIIGRIPKEEVGQYFQKASVFCMPTKMEPFGIVFVEAMLNKLPIVSCDIGALPDMVKNNLNGFLINSSNDTQKLKEYLAKLLSDKYLCEKMGEAGYKMAIDKYTWSMVGQKVKSHISDTL